MFINGIDGLTNCKSLSTQSSSDIFSFNHLIRLFNAFQLFSCAVFCLIEKIADIVINIHI